MNNFFSKLALAATLTFSALSAHADYTFSFANNFYGSSINDSGIVAGNNRASNVAALWDGTRITDLPMLPNSNANVGSYAVDINNSGSVVGYSHKYEYGAYIRHATVWDNETVTDLGTYGLHSDARLLNDSGVVLGSADQVVTYPWGTYAETQQMSWSSGAATPINVYAADINNAGQMLAYNQIQNSDGTTINLGTIPNTQSTNYTSLNDLGQAVGSANVRYGFYGNTTPHAILWDGENAVDLGTLVGDDRSSAQDINNLGQIVGYSYNSQIGNTKPVLWDGDAAIDVNSLLNADLVSAGWVLQTAEDINNVGTIMGSAYNIYTGMSGTYTLAPVPEADTSAMLLMGAGVMGLMARRRKRQLINQT
jgi:probable HAF family extracellular repeat protein